MSIFYNSEAEDILDVLLNVGEFSDDDVRLMASGFKDFYYDETFLANDKTKNAIIEMAKAKYENAPEIFDGKRTVKVPSLNEEEKRTSQINHRFRMIEQELGKNHSYSSIEEGLLDTARSLAYYVSHRLDGEDEMYFRHSQRYDTIDEPGNFYYIARRKENGEIANSFDETIYWNKVKHLVENHKQFGDQVYATSEHAHAFLKSLTYDEIVSNSINKEIRIRGKRYGIGAKLTRVLGALSDMGLISTQLSNSFNLQEVRDDIYITANPFMNAVAGDIGNSCYSQGSENSYANINSTNYKEVILAFSANIDWRAFIVVDKDNMKATIHDGYPETRIQNLRMIETFLDKKGYTIVRPEYFYFYSYWSYDGPYRMVEGEQDSYLVEPHIMDGMTYAEKVFLPSYDVGNGFLTTDHGREESLGYCEHCDEYQEGVSYIEHSYVCRDCADSQIRYVGETRANDVRNTILLKHILSEENQNITADELTDDIDYLTRTIEENYNYLIKLVMSEVSGLYHIDYVELVGAGKRMAEMKKWFEDYSGAFHYSLVDSGNSLAYGLEDAIIDFTHRDEIAEILEYYNQEYFTDSPDLTEGCLVEIFEY